MSHHSVIFWGKVLISIACCFPLSAAVQCLGDREPCENDATCIRNNNGTGYCSCLAGFRGDYCQHRDSCHPGNCRNGGNSTGNPGLSSIENDGCKAKPCQNNGVCSTDHTGKFFCECSKSSGYTGDTCSEDINECTLGPNPCERDGRCVNTEGSFTCNCTAGYGGQRCDEDLYQCVSLPCFNGATCMDQMGSFKCICMPGFTGVHCEQDVRSQDQDNSSSCPPEGSCQDMDDPCSSNPCHNGGICSRNSSATHGFTCICKPGSLVPDCAQVDGTMSPGSEINGHMLEQQSWHDCPAKLRCWELFSNKKCDHECNTAACLFDNFDCKPKNPCRYSKYCTDHYGNGFCDNGCNTEDCGWDGLDCADGSGPRLAGGTLVLVLQAPPEVLRLRLPGLLRELGMTLHTNLRVHRDANGDDMLLPDYGPGAQGKGSKVFLEIDNRQCAAQANSRCFSTAEQAAAFLTAVHWETPLDLPLVSIRSEQEEKKPPDQTNMLYLIALVVGPVLFILVVLVAKRKRKLTTLWLPEGFLINSQRRREPVGQDNMDLEDMKPGEYSPVNSDLNQRWLHGETRAKKIKVEDVSLLPADEAMPGPDLREWAPQHHRAADLTLTPPQAEMDSLDVNIRGPDGLTPLMLASVCHGGMVDSENLPEEAEGEEEDSEQEARPNIITDLVALGATLQAQTDGMGETALHLAARYARSDATKRLLDAGADANAQDRMGRTPLHAAVAADAQGVFQILIRNRATDLNARMDDGTTPLILAARLAVEGMVEQLAHCHADVNAVDVHGKSALHWAAAVNNVEAVLILVKNGANRDLQDLKEETPLFLAAREGSFDAARVLLDHCCSRDITDHLDQLPRDVACERMHHDIVQLLDHYNLAPGADRPLGRGLAPAPAVSGGGAQGKKGRRVGNSRTAGEEMKTKHRKKPCSGAGVSLGVARRAGANCPTVAERANGGSSPVNCLESPHTVTRVTAASPLLVTTPPVHMPLLPPVTHMLGQQQQAWKEQTKPNFRPHMCRLLEGQFDTPCPEQYSVDVPLAREPLLPVLAFQLPRGSTGSLLDQGHAEALSRPQQGAPRACFAQGQTFPQSVMMGVPQPLPHPLPYGHSPGEAPAPRLQHESPVDKYPTPPSQRSYATTGLEGSTPAPHPPHPTKHPYLTPSPESPDPWSSSSSPSPHSTSDWSDVTSSPVPRHANAPRGGPLPTRQPHPQEYSCSSMQGHP
ncbi:neurogenic locus notch homolog protein 1-like [Brienomyrus brachyistius]|uniref:neurogenic locus notch homolog protein 1-like n=1 Tax=Brienomyrus brachyistius TaxID=42636 RepID=UPI0020B388E7|nr:neurogenic locus notch homolog protein 1-like [Brienomyrus brachyistius]